MTWRWLMVMALVLIGTGGAVAGTTPDTHDQQQILVLQRLAPPHFRGHSDYAGAYDDAVSGAERQRIAARIAHAHRLTLVTDWPMPMLGLDCFVMGVPDGERADAVAREVAADRDVVWAEPVHAYRAQAGTPSPNDPLFAAQPAAALWGLAVLHQVTTGRGVRVAVIDSQVETGHPDLKGQVSDTHNFVTGRDPPAELHGTGVAGIIAARSGNGLGIVGIAPDARLMALRACWQVEHADGAPTTACDSFSLAKALYFAIEHNAQVANLSLAGPDDRLLASLVDLGLARGMAIVAAVDPALPGGGFPASHGGVIAVSDVPFAGLWQGVYTAPGHDIPTTQPGGRWYLVNGSSYAAAHVSGLIALLRQVHGGGEGSSGLVPVAGGPINACASLMRATRNHEVVCDMPRQAAADARQ
jgi:subtilisin family serine protease